MARNSLFLLLWSVASTLYADTHISILPTGALYAEKWEKGRIHTISKEGERGDPLWTLSFTYDEKGRILSQTYHSTSLSAVYHFGWDKEDHLIFKQSPEGSYHYTYDTEGRLTSKIWGNGAALYFQYNKQGLLSRLFSSEGDLDYLITYKKGKIATVYNQITEAMTERFYNETGELIAEKLENGLTSYHHHQNNDSPYVSKTLLPTTQKEKKAHSIQKNLLGKVIHCDGIDLSYDFFGRLMSKKSPNEKSLFLWDLYHEIGRYSEDFKEIERRTINPQGMTLECSIEGKKYEALHDQHGNLICLWDPVKNIEAGSFCYDAFGQMEQQGVFCPWSYQNERYDPDLGLYYMGYRLYDPGSHTFLTEDPGGFTWLPFTHLFCLNDPINYREWQGLFPIHRQWLDIPLSDALTPSYYDADREEKELSYSYIAASRLYGLLSGDLLENPDKYGQASLSHHHITAPSCEERLPGLELFFINGIGNSFSDATSNAEMISSLFQLPVDLLYNVSYSFTEDIIRALKTAGNSTFSRQIERVKQLFEEIADDEKTREVHWLCHSEGAAITERALEMMESPAIKRLHPKLRLYSFGGAIPIDPSFGIHVSNVVSSKDPIPGIVSFLTSHQQKEPPHILPSSALLWEHALFCETYRKEIARIAKNLDLLSAKR